MFEVRSWFMRENYSPAKVAFIITGSGLFVVMGYALLTVSVVPFDVAVLGIAMMFFALLPSMVFLLRSNPGAIPFFALTGLFYFGFYALPIFTIPLRWPDANTIIIHSQAELTTINTDVVFVAAAGILLLILGYYAGGRVLTRQNLKFSLPKSVELTDIRPLLWLLLVSHFVYKLALAHAAIPSIGQFLEPAVFVATGGFFLLWRRGRLSSLETFILVVICLPFIVYTKIKFLFLTEIILFLIFWLFLCFREKLVRTVVVLIGTSVIVVSVYGATTASRSGHQNNLDRLIYAGQAFLSQMVKGEEAWNPAPSHRVPFVGRFGSLVERTSQIWVFHIVANKSPDPVPYWGGETYKPLPTSFIPRLIYPKKPLENNGARFGQRYGFLEPTQTNTSFNLPWMTELLANFGPAGVYVGMPLIGLILAAIVYVFLAPRCSDLAFVIGLTAFFPLVYPESNFSLMVGALLPLLVALVSYFWIGSKCLKLIERRTGQIEPRKTSV